MATIFPKYESYKQFGVELKKRAKEQLPEVFDSLGIEISRHLAENIEPYPNWAYFEVQAQTLLIDMDIVGIHDVTLSERSWDAAFAVGLPWYAIKLVDNEIDKPGMTYPEVEDFLDAILETWQHNHVESSLSGRQQQIAEATNALIHSGYVANPETYIPIYDQLTQAEKRRWNSDPSNRVNLGKQVFVLCADLTINTAQHYVPEFPNGCEDFIREQGITGGIFDDWKDRIIDFPEDEGYSPLQKINIITQGVYHVGNHFLALPIKAQWKNAGFLALASMFHVQEALGYKGRS